MNAAARSTEEEAAFAALRERQGSGARYDSALAPARELLWARRGAAYFARKLNELGDSDLDGPSRLDGIGRRLLVSMVGYHARSLARIADAAREGRSKESFEDPGQPPDDAVLGATLPAHALRHLFAHSQAHLSVAWRDLSDAAWDRTIETLDGRRLSPRQTVSERAISIWHRTVDLGNGGAASDFPPDLPDATGPEATTPVRVEPHENHADQRTPNP